METKKTETQANGKELTRGERMVRLDFHMPDSEAGNVKRTFANLIDREDDRLRMTPDPEVKREIALAITHLQEACRYIVGAITWPYGTKEEKKGL